MSSTEKGLLHYFARPSTLDEELHSSGWTKVGETDIRYKFWSICWKEKVEPERISRENHISKEDLIKPSHKAESFPALDHVNTKQGTTPALCREEYKNMYKWLVTRPVIENVREAVVITGHPGIGKTVFGNYVLYRRCVERRPTLYLDPLNSDHLYLFHEGGVLQLVFKGFDSLGLFTHNTWLLLDQQTLNPAIHHMPPNMEHPHIILTASPANKNTWFIWTKRELSVTLTYMWGWTDRELQFGFVLHKSTECNSWAEVEERRAVVGPVPRYLFATTANYDIQKGKIKDAANSLNNDQLRQLFSSQAVVSPKDDRHFSHSLQLQIRAGEDFRAPPEVAVLSDYVAQQLRGHYFRMKNEERADLIYMYSGPAQTRVMAGTLYEIHILERLSQGKGFQGYLYRMVRLSGSSGGGPSLDETPDDTPEPVTPQPEEGDRRKRKNSATEGGAGKKPRGNQPQGKGPKGRSGATEGEAVNERQSPELQWHTAYGRATRTSTLEQARADSLKKPRPLELMFKDTYFYEPASTETVVVEDGKLYIPYISNEVGIDAFYVGSVEDENGGETRVLSLLKMTVAASHSLNAGICGLTKRFQGLPKKWRLIFVQPYETCLKVPYVKDLSRVELFHVRISPSSLEEQIPPPKESQEVDNGEDSEDSEEGDEGDDTEG